MLGPTAFRPSSLPFLTEETPLGSDRDRVDIAIEGATFILFVEIKIDAAEGEEQLSGMSSFTSSATVWPEAICWTALGGRFGSGKGV